MSGEAKTEVEARRARVALAAVIAASILIVAGQALAVAALGDASDSVERLVARAMESSQTIAGAAIGAVGQALLVVPLLLLFDAAAARTGGRMDRFRLLVMIGPPVFAIAQVITAIGVDQVAQDFVAGTPISGTAGEDRAEELFANSTLVQISTGIGFAGILSIVFGTVYSALWGMRTGLLTRFWGTLGMAFGAFLFLGSFVGSPIGLLGTLFFLLHVALVAGGRWPGDQPPAWGAGVAVPWDERDAERFGGASPPPEEELARPEDFEGSGRDATEDEDDRSGRREDKRKRKRKQRGR